MTAIDPDALSRDGALAYWVNLYNAGALDLAGRAFEQGADGVFRLPGAFTTPFVEVAGETLTLDDVEHGKVRRFGDPRVHAALVCGSVSCPTLRAEPFRGDEVGRQLDAQMRGFLADGGAVPQHDANRIALSRVFLWYGADFVRPGSMPALLPARRAAILAAVRPWLDDETATWVDAVRPLVRFQAYDWGLGCSVGGR
jgi:hypothetical protein